MPTMQELLEAGVHFGHQTRRWNPRMKPYIFIERNGIHIIDLQKTMQCLQAAQNAVANAVRGGGTVLFVGTKKQAKEIIIEEAVRSGQYSVTERWLGGMLTNFKTIRSSLARLKELDRMVASGVMASLSKKEAARLDKERQRLEKVFSGIKDMDRLPSVVFVVDTNKERIAVAEANRLGIPVVGIVDTNSTRSSITHPGQRRCVAGDQAHRPGHGRRGFRSERQARRARTIPGLLRGRGCRGGTTTLRTRTLAG
jgi:small subunit ribosomal protein S2